MYGPSKGFAGGRANKKMKKYPRILDYLEAHHPAVYELFDDLAAHGMLTPRKGGGVTFLLPDDALIKEIRKTIESDNPEDATDMLSSLILTEYLGKPEDFKKEDISTLMGTKLVVKKVSADSVEIDDGKLTLDAKFTPFKRHGQRERGKSMAVWKLHGYVNYKGAPKSKISRGGRFKPSEARFMRGGADDDRKLKELIASIEKEKIECIKEDRGRSSGGEECPFMCAVTQILRVISSDRKYRDLYMMIKCLIYGNPTNDFYLIFGSYGSGSLFDSSLILEAYHKGIKNDHNVDTYKKFIYEFNSEIASDPAKLLHKESLMSAHKKRDEVRNAILAGGALKKNIEKTYQEMDEKNTIDGYGPLYPEVLSQKFKANRGLHLQLNSFAYCVCERMKTWNESAVEQRVSGIIEMFKAIHDELPLHASQGKMEITFTNLCPMDENAHALGALKGFVQKCAFHMPPTEESGDLDERIMVGAAEDDDDPYSRELIDMDGDNMRKLDKYDNCPACVSNNTISEMRAYMRAHGGKLPDELSS